MSRMPWAMYLWPGLPQLWQRGSWSAVALAVGSAVLVNGLLLGSFVWVELVGPWQLRLGWSAAAALWIVAAIVAVGATRKEGPAEAMSSEALFRQALSEYLLGSWFEAETILGRLLRLDPRDVEARLMLATLLRHTGRPQEALDHLDRLERLRGAEHWSREIAAERRLLAEQAESTAVESDSTGEPSSQPFSQRAA